MQRRASHSSVIPRVKLFVHGRKDSCAESSSSDWSFEFFEQVPFFVGRCLNRWTIIPFILLFLSPVRWQDNSEVLFIHFLPEIPLVLLMICLLMKWKNLNFSPFSIEIFGWMVLVGIEIRRLWLCIQRHFATRLHFQLLEGSFTF